jgi:hypothetical protein
MYDLHLLDEAPFIDLPAERGASDPDERLFAAALLTATAFRMKDMEGLLYALRTLVAAVEGVEDARETV